MAIDFIGLGSQKQVFVKILISISSYGRICMGVLKASGLKKIVVNLLFNHTGIVYNS